MKYMKHIYACFYLWNGKILDPREEASGTLSLLDVNPTEFIIRCAHDGKDGICLISLSDAVDDSFLTTILSDVDIPVFVGGVVTSANQAKHWVSLGASGVILSGNDKRTQGLVQEVCKDLTKEQVMLYCSRKPSEELKKVWSSYDFSVILYDGEFDVSIVDAFDTPVLLHGGITMEEGEDYLSKDKVFGISSNLFLDFKVNAVTWKSHFADCGIQVQRLVCYMPFFDFKKNNDGMVPVIVQDYRNNEVLMLAYINEEAWNHTVKTGHMTYYSRSRNELWEKGLTSGHFQFVKSVYADCDSDTLLVKVYQVGAACHTGRRSCFFKKAYCAEDGE